MIQAPFSAFLPTSNMQDRDQGGMEAPPRGEFKPSREKVWPWVLATAWGTEGASTGVHRGRAGSALRCSCVADGQRRAPLVACASPCRWAPVRG